MVVPSGTPASVAMSSALMCSVASASMPVMGNAEVLERTASAMASAATRVMTTSMTLMRVFAEGRRRLCSRCTRGAFLLASRTRPAARLDEAPLMKEGTLPDDEASAKGAILSRLCGFLSAMGPPP